MGLNQTGKGIVVSVDGPSASGKSSVSRGVASRLGFIYCDSGAVYRAVTWKALREDVDINDEDAVLKLVNETKWGFVEENNAMTFKLDGIDPGEEIRSALVADNVSIVAKMPSIRKFVVARLREMRKFGDLVMEGRDIGSVVFPAADFKYYLDASAEERARRRHADYLKQNHVDGIENVYKSLQRRDQTDKSRKNAPLRVPDDAEVIDSTVMSKDEVIDFIEKDIREKMEWQ